VAFEFKTATFCIAFLICFVLQEQSLFVSEFLHVMPFVLLLYVYKVILGVGLMASLVKLTSVLCNRVR